ncbi:hypothetical protein D3C75_673730 [compost metagenome]
MEYIKSWQETLSDARERKRMKETMPSYSQHRYDLTRTQQILSLMLYLFFMPPAGRLLFLSPAYTVIKGCKTTTRRITASTT